MRTSSVLLLVVLIFTFPLWIGIIGGFFGLMAGLIGGAIGIVAGVFGAVFGVIGAMIGGIFEFLFGGHFHFNTFWFAIIILCVALLVRSRGQTR